METPAAGDVVLVPFPFSDLSNTKLRPAVVLAAAGQGDFVLCQVTSRSYGDGRAVALDDRGFESGSLRMSSFARPAKLFTAHRALLVGRVASLTRERLAAVVTATVRLLESGGVGP